MALNFGILQQLQSQQQGQPSNPNQQNPIMLSSGGNGGSDIGSGLGSLMGGISKVLGGATNPTSGGNGTSVADPATNNGTPLSQTVSPQMGTTPLNPQSGSIPQGAISGQMQQTVFHNAMQELGVKENSPTLSAYLSKANPNLDPNSTPWCAGFVGSVLNASGLKGTDSLSAKSYLNYGTPTTNPSQGDIVVLNRGNDPALGHVGFVQSIDKQNGTVSILGGNQDNSVSVKSFPLTSVAGFRSPPSGTQVQNYAKQNGITSPTQLMKTGSAGTSPDPYTSNPVTTSASSQTPTTSLSSSPLQGSQSTQQGQVNSFNPNHGQALTLPSFSGQPDQPRGLRNNNPGNIEKSNSAYGQEVKGTDARFATFSTPQEGISALDHLLTNKYNGQTLTQVISKYAPSSENNTQSYISSVAKQAGIDPNQPLDFHNPSTKMAVMKGIISIENGKNPYSDAQLQAVIMHNKTMRTTLNDERTGNRPGPVRTGPVPQPPVQVAANTARFTPNNPNNQEAGGSWSFPVQPPGSVGGMPNAQGNGNVNMPQLNDYNGAPANSAQIAGNPVNFGILNALRPQQQA